MLDPTPTPATPDALATTESPSPGSPGEPAPAPRPEVAAAEGASVAPRARAKERSTWLATLSTHLAVVAGMTAMTALHTWPTIKQVRGYILGNNEDTWMNIWHLWWMRQALWVHPQNPFHSPLVHYPLGADMYWHTLCFAKTAWGALLLAFMTPESAYTVVFLATFVMTGYTGWLLLRDRLEKAGSAPLHAFVAAFVGACAFNFSRYHMCQANNHLNLGSLEGVPLYLFFFFRYLERGRRRDLVGVALAALYTLLCEYYYLAYLAVFSAFWIAAMCWQRKPLLRWRSLQDLTVRRGAHIALAVAVACAPMLAALLIHAFPQPVSPYHGDVDYYADLAGFVYPDRWSGHFAAMSAASRNLVEHLEGNGEEGGFFIGYVTPVLCLLGMGRGLPDRKRWLALGVLFATLSLGVTLTVAGVRDISPTYPIGVAALAIALSRTLRKSPLFHDLGIFLGLSAVYLYFFPITANGGVWKIQIPLPYALFKSVVPLFGRGGMPVRLEVVLTLTIGVLLANSAAELAKLLGRHRVLGAALALVLLVAPTYEYRQVLPWANVPVGQTSPIHEQIRKEDPGIAVFTDGSVLAQYEQTRHHHPITFARLSRVPVKEEDMMQGPLWQMLQHHHDLLGRKASPDIDAEMREYLKTNRIKYYVSHSRDAACDRFITERLKGTKAYDGPYMEGWVFPYVK